MIVIPAVLARELGWIFGDNIVFHLLDNGMVYMERVNVVDVKINIEK